MSAPTITEPATSTPALRTWLGLAVLLTGTFVAQVDFFVVNIALPSMQRDLSASLSQVQLIAVAYGASYAITVVTAGRLGDLYGRRRLFIAGLGAFAIASLLCGLAPTAWLLVGARVVQGVAAAVIMPQAIGSLHALFPGEGRTRAFSIFGVSMGLAWVSGIALGGLLLGADLFGWGWRAIFLVNVPLVAIVLAGALTILDESRKPDRETSDLAGMALLAVLIGLIVLPLVQGRQSGWPLWSIICLALVVPAALALRRAETGVRRAGRSPVLPPDLFADGNFRFGLAVIVVFFLGPPGFFLLLTLYQQAVLRLSPIQAGLSLLPFGAAFVVTSWAVKRLRDRFGDSVIIAGTVVMAVGVAAVAYAIWRAGDGLTPLMLQPGMLIIGVGQALFTTPLYDLLLRTIRKEIAATASAVFTTVQLIAQSLSVAVIVIVFTSLLQTRIEALATRAGPATTAALAECRTDSVVSFLAGRAVRCASGGPQVEKTVADVTAAGAREAFVRTLAVNLFVVVASGAITALGLRRRPKSTCRAGKSGSITLPARIR